MLNLRHEGGKGQKQIEDKGGQEALQKAKKILRYKIKFLITQFFFADKTSPTGKFIFRCLLVSQFLSLFSENMEGSD